MLRPRRISAAFLLVGMPFLFLGVALTAGAQGTVHGTITDPLGATVKNAKVTLLQGSTVIGSTESDDQGTFSFSSVPSGRYHIQVEAAGFAGYVGDDSFVGSEGAEVDAVLQIGALKQRVVVSATGTETPISQVGASVTLIDNNEIQAQNKLDVLEDLRQVPGAQIVQTSQRGGPTSLFIRGGESDFNKILIDGITINAIGGDFDFAQLSNNGVESVEVLRGSNSVLYGSDALAGVLNITTKHGDTSFPEVRYSVDGGDFGTLNEDVSLSGFYRLFDYFSEFSRFDTQGSYPNDFFHNATVSGNIGFHINSNTELRLTGRNTSTDLGEPNAIEFYGISDDSWAKHKITYMGATLQNQTTSRWHNLVRFAFEQDNLFNDNPTCTGTPDGMGDCFGNTVTIRGANGTSGTGQAELDSVSFAGPFPQIYYESEARRSAYAQSDYQFTRDWTGTFGFRYEHEDGSGITRNNYSYFLEGHGSVAHRFYLTAGVGLEDNAVYRFAAAPRVSAAYYLRAPATSGFFTDIKLIFNFGQGIKEEATYEQTSSLYALLTPAQRLQYNVGPIGPERSRTFDGGVEQGLWNGKARLEATFFGNNFYDLVTYLSPAELIAIGVPPGAAEATVYGAYVNATSTRALGFETGVTIDLGHGLMIKGFYTYLNALVTKAFGAPAENPNYPTIPIGAFSPLQGQRAFRRPPDTGSFLVLYSHKRITGTIAGYIVSRSDDSTFLEYEDENFGNTLLLPNRNLNFGYQKIDLSARYSLTHYMSIYSSLENILNEHYTPAFGFPALPFSIRGGVTFIIGGFGGLGGR